MPPAASVAASSYEMKEEDFAYLQKLPGNKFCVDCGAPKPDWGSPKLGIFFCFRCSGIHRGLGTHISFVRSVTMDAWKDKEIRLMKAGGNQQCLDFLRAHGIVDNSSNSNGSDDGGGGGDNGNNLPLRNVPAKKKYDSPAAELYRQVLQARIDGLPEPTELLVRTESSVSRHSSSSLSRKDSATAANNSNGRRAVVDKSRIQGFGSNGINNGGVGSSGYGCGGGPSSKNGSKNARKIVQKCLWVTVTVVTLGGALWFAKNHH